MKCIKHSWTAMYRGMEFVGWKCRNCGKVEIATHEDKQQRHAER